MLVKKIAAIVLAFGIVGIGSTTFAQSDEDQPAKKTIFDRLDDFGKSIFDGILPQKKPESKEMIVPRPTSTVQPRKVVMPREERGTEMSQHAGRRSGSVLSGGTTSRRLLVPKSTSEDDLELMPENTPPAVPRRAVATTSAERVAPAETSILENIRSTSERSTVVTGKSVGAITPEAIESLGEIEEPATTSAPPMPPMHQRLSTIRRSIFSEGAESDEAKPADQSSADEPKLPAVESRETSSNVGATDPSRRPAVAQRPTPKNERTAFPLDEPSSEATADVAAGEEGPAKLTTEENPSSAAEETGDRTLFSRKGPLLSVETLGPRKISVGKESTYDVSISNSGEAAAEDLVVFVSLPLWAEVVRADVGAGSVQALAKAQDTATVEWRLGHLDAKGQQRMSLKLIPRESRPFDLAVRWEYKPTASQVMIDVQEPKLALQLEGPREVLYGKAETYRLKLINSGNGPAENVALMLMPIGGGENVPATHKIRQLAAGEEKILDVELTARQSGNLTIQVDARADGGVHAELAEKVLVRRAGLKIDVEGPKVQFVGVATTYVVRIRNTGTAAAQNIRMSVTLPAGAKYLSGVDGAQLAASDNQLAWTLESLKPESEQSFSLKCNLGSAGLNRLQVQATADDDLTASVAVVTQVETVANLTLEVKEPTSPVAVGEDAIYEVRVRNRGTKAAEGVEVFAYFSRGIEPVEAEGAPNRLGPGLVAFQPIVSLAPGAEAVFTIRAKAETAGNHIFRTEAHCKPLGARLIRETTNLYYTDTLATTSPETPNTGESAPDSMRTVTRPNQGEPSVVAPLK